MSSQEAFRKHFKARLEKLGWSPADFARRQKIAATNVYRWLSGDVVPSLDVLDRIAGTLGEKSWELIKPVAEGTAQEAKPKLEQLLPTGMLEALESATPFQLETVMTVLEAFATGAEKREILEARSESRAPAKKRK